MTTATLAFLTPQSSMFLMFILLLMFGAKKLPELARGLGQAMKEFSKAKNDVHDEIMKEPPTMPQITQQPAQQIPAPVQPQPAVGVQPQTVAQAAPVAPAPAPTVTVEPPVHTA